MLKRIWTRQFWFQFGSLVSALTLFSLLTHRLHGLISEAHQLIMVLVCAVLGMATADLASGIVHWFFDTYGTPETPFWGPNFIKNFRVHHDDPKNITHTDFIQINGDNSFISAVFFGLVWVFTDPEPSHFSVSWMSWAIAFGFMSIFTNLFHQWAHKDEPPSVARFLHRWNLAISPAKHDIHHIPPYRTDYCITLGWLNPLTRRIGFFRFLEKTLAFLCITPCKQVVQDLQSVHSQS